MQIVVGKRGLKEGKVEMKLRRTGEKKEVALDALAEMMGFAAAPCATTSCTAPAPAPSPPFSGRAIDSSIDEDPGRLSRFGVFLAFVPNGREPRSMH